VTGVVMPVLTLTGVVTGVLVVTGVVTVPGAMDTICGELTASGIRSTRKSR